MSSIGKMPTSTGMEKKNKVQFLWNTSTNLLNVTHFSENIEKNSKVIRSQILDELTNADNANGFRVDKHV